MADDDAATLYQARDDALSTATWKAQTTPPVDLRTFTAQTAAQYGVDPRLVESMIRAESNGNPQAVSRAGAQGLMQLMPGTAKRFGVQNPLDPRDNILGGIKYLAFLKNMFPGRLDLQLAAYNAGEGAVKAYGNQIPPYPETLSYVPKVMALYQGGGDAPLMAFQSRATQEAQRVPDGTRPVQGLSIDRPIINPDDLQALTQDLGDTSLPPSSTTLGQTPVDAGTPPLVAPGNPPVAFIGHDAQARIQQELAPQLPTGPIAVDLTRGMPAPTPPTPPFQGGVTVGEGKLPEPQPPANPQAPFPGTRTIPPFGVGTPKDSLQEGWTGRVVGGIAQGALGLLKTTLDFVPAVEEYLGLHGGTLNISLGTPDLSHLLGQAEQAVAPKLGDNGPQFLDKTANAIGMLLAGVVPAAATGRFLQGLAAVAPTTAHVASAITGGILQGAAIAGSLFEQLRPILGDDQASKRALMSFGLNAGLTALTERFGIFGEAASGVRQVVNSVLLNGLQQTVQYDVERRLLTVPADNPSAPILLHQGWVQQGQSLVKPFVPTDAAEAALIGMLIAPLGAAVAKAIESRPGPAQDAVKADAEAVAPEIPNTLVKGADGLPLRVYLADDKTFQSTPDATHTQPVYVDVVSPRHYEGDGVGRVTQDRQVVPAFSIDAALQAQQRTAEAAPAETAPPISPTIRERWQALLDKIIPPPPPGGTGILGSERGSISRRPVEAIRADLQALDVGGTEQQAVLDRLGVATPAEASTVLANELQQAATASPAPDSSPVPSAPGRSPLVTPGQKPETTPAPPSSLAPDTGPAPSIPSTGATAPLPAPTLATGGEGIPRDRFRTDSGAWRVPLRDMPSRELELQDFIAQQGGIRLQGEELRGEFAAVTTRKEAGLTTLHNDRTGLTAQAMAERAAEHGFLPSADKEALLNALDQSVTLGRPVYSREATGYVPLLDNPTVAAGYQAVSEAIRTLDARTTEQRRGVRPHAEVLAEAHDLLASGGFTLDDVRELYPGTALPDAQLGATVLALHQLNQHLLSAIETYVAGGRNQNSHEAADVLSLMAMAAELDPARRGVIAEAGRSLSFLNDPVSAYNQYLDDMRQTLAKGGTLTLDRLVDKLRAVPTVATRLAQTPQEAVVSQAGMLKEVVGRLYDTVHQAAEATPFTGANALTAAQDTVEEIGQRLRQLIRVAPASSRETLVQWQNHWAEIAHGLEATLLPGVLTDDTQTQKAMQDFARQVRLFASKMEGTFQAPMTHEELQAHFARLNAEMEAEGLKPLAFTNEPEQMALMTREEMQSFEEGFARSKALAQANMAERQAAIDAEQERLRALYAKYDAREEAARQQPLTFTNEPEQLSLMTADEQQSFREGLARSQELSKANEVERQRALEAERQRLEALYATYAQRELPIQPALPLRAEQPTDQPLFPDLSITQAPATPVQSAANAQGVTPEALWQMGLLAKAAKPGLSDYFLELWYNALLSNPSTMIVKTMSDISTAAWAIPERFLAEHLTSAGQGHVEKGEAAAMLYGLVHGIPQAWAVAKRAFELSQSQTGFGHREQESAMIGAQSFGLDPQSPYAKAIDFFFNYIGLASGGRLPSRAILATDEFWKVLNYSMELNALAFRSAVSQGYEGTAFTDHVAEVTHAPTLAQMQEASRTFAINQTFQHAIEPGTLEYGVNFLANVKLGDFPIGRAILPFVKTPANIARYAVERTPLGLGLQSVRDDLAAGGARGELAQAKILLGTMTMAAVAAATMGGRVTGRGPEDPELRAAWLDTHQEYSLQLPGGLWMNYDRFDPIGMVIGMTADMTQLMGEAHIPLAERIPVAILYAFIKNIGSKTYMQGLSNFFDALSPRPYAKLETTGANVERFMQRQVTRMVQPSAGLAGLARAIDPVQKETSEFLDALYARIPGWSLEVPARRSLDGSKIIRGWGFAPEILANTLRAFTPLKLEIEHPYAADQEILANKMSLSQVPRTLFPHAMTDDPTAPGAVDTSSNADATQLPTLRLTDAQHERFAVLATLDPVKAREIGVEVPRAVLGNVTSQLAATLGATPPRQYMPLGPMLDWVVKTDAYRNPQLTPGPEGGKEQLMQAIVRAYREVGKQLLLAQDFPLRARYEAAKLQKSLQLIPAGDRPGIAQHELQNIQEHFQTSRAQLGLPPAPDARPTIGAPQ